jgi:diadenosine tetraphosphate (Ap4A) HIT family hydrolase
MSAWQLDARLQRDSEALIEVGAIEVRAMPAMVWPWLLLVPRYPGAVEAFDLPPQEATALGNLTLALARALKDEFKAVKINIGALGNVVPQLHVHIVARQLDDPAWPAPVWGQPAVLLDAAGTAQRRQRLLALAQACASQQQA